MHNILKQIDDLIDRITMYKLLLWGLRILFAISWLFSIAGILPYGPIRPLISISILLGVCFGINYILAKFYKVAANNESTNITALLLFFIFQPPKTIYEGVGLAIAGSVAVASKYVVTRHERHLFNPAAFGAMVVGLTGILSSRWWIGRDTMVIFVIVLGLLLVRKIHRFPMVLSFACTAALLAIARNDAGLTEAIKLTVLSFPIAFFGAFMLTEPVTTPPRRYQQIAYGVLVGMLFSSGWNIGSISLTPELSLLIGNLVVFFIASRKRQPLKFLGVEEIGNTIYEYRFKPVTPVTYTAGQYMELTLPLKKTDFRGNRRTFTIASSPTEDEVRFGIKQVEPTSAFKTALSNIHEGHQITGNNLAGDFVLPKDHRTKLVFIAGGIGITPFRSMLKYMTDKKQSRPVTLFYAVSNPKQIVYKDILEQAKEFGLKVVYVLTPVPGQEAAKSWKGEAGIIDEHLIAKHVLDYKERVFYISGPSAMVRANKKLLRDMKLPRDQIITDYFSGY